MTGNYDRDRFYLVDLGSAANNKGISSRATLADGGFNVWGNSYPSEEMPAGEAIVEFGDFPFRFPGRQTRCADNVVCTGQRISFEEGIFCGMSVLGAAERRSANVMTFVADTGACRAVPLCLSDWWPGARSHFRNRLALRSSCLHYPRHIQTNMSPAIWVHSVAFASIRAGVAVLPDNPALHIFSLTLEFSRYEANSR